MNNKQNGINLLKEVVKEGDVININNNPAWYNIPSQIACFGIREAQHSLFKRGHQIYNYGETVFCNRPCDDTHTMMYFKIETIKKVIYGNLSKINETIKFLNNDLTTFSVEPPKAKFISFDDYPPDGEISIYRFKKFELTNEHIEIMLNATLDILNTEYDYGQLINILVNQFLGYGYDEKIKWFDLGSKRKVCSVGVAVLFQILRHELEKKGIVMQRLFSKLNKEYWDYEFIEKFKKNGSHWNVENTYPAMFGLTETHFDNEFKLVAKINKGKLLYRG